MQAAQLKPLHRDNYQLLRIYTYYRTALGCLLLLLFVGNFASQILGSFAPRWFFVTAAIYTAFNLATLIGLWRNRSEPSARQLVLYLFIDVAALTMMAGSSGGIASGLSYLLVITVAAGAILLNRQLATFIAATATVATLSESVITAWLFGIESNRMFSAGALGVLLFATALLFQYLTQRIRESTAEANLRTAEAAKARDISQRIIERMRTGVVVTNPSLEIQLINDAAKQLLGISETTTKDSPSPLALQQLPLLSEAYSHWQSSPTSPTRPIRVPKTNGEIRINFAQLGESNTEDTIIFIEDHRLLAQEAQKLKLGSLGKLTASIAHEVRNPLGAISHAAQLLKEAPELSSQSLRLLDIMLNHSQRVNQIIENTLQLSRRNHSQAQIIDLARWLPNFVEEYRQTIKADSDLNISLIKPEKGYIQAKIDVNHLRQVLTNLFDNGLRYSKAATGKATLTLRLDHRPETELAQLRVIDDGPGVSSNMEESIFEPFFTTESTGSGLGLYICRELCQSNQASLSFARWQGKSCFQINFAHPHQVF